MRVPLIYRVAPLFGLDLGSYSIKIAQVRSVGKRVEVLGYSTVEFPAGAVVEGIITDPKGLAALAKQALIKPEYGKITARRIAASLPVTKVFTQSLHLPAMNAKDLAHAVQLEVEQNVPVPLTDLYVDFEVIPSHAKSKDQMDVLMVAAPKAIVDSYMKFFDAMDLEVDSIEISLAAITRAMNAAKPVTQTTMLIDMGSRSSDLAIYDTNIRLTGTIDVGGDQFTKTLVSKFNITAEQANQIKQKFGIGPSDMQAKVQEAIAEHLDTIVTEIKKFAKYYKERSESTQDVVGLILTGGSASMPGLVDYLYAKVGLPIILGNPLDNLATSPVPGMGKLHAPSFTTALGLALREVTK